MAIPRGYGLRELMRDLAASERGRHLRRRYFRKYRVRQRGSYVALFPKRDEELWEAFFRASDRLEEDRELIVLASDREMERCIPRKMKQRVRVEYLKEKETASLVRYFSFTFFYERFFLVSLDQPQERRCRQLVGKRGITVERLVADGVMKEGDE